MTYHSASPLPTPSTSGSLLMIEDDLRLANMVVDYLGRSGLTVVHAATVAAATAWLAQHQAALVLLDLMLPDGDGLTVCRTLRAQSDVPIIMLTARGDATDRVVGLELGADDYLPKPFEPRELLARIRAVLRRRGAPAEPSGAAQALPPLPLLPLLRFGRLEIDREARQARLSGQVCELTGHQFTLLCAMAERAGRVLSREQLMELVRGEALEAFDRSIDVHIARIRSVIEDDPKHPRRIITLRGAGYVFAKLQDAA